LKPHLGKRLEGTLLKALKILKRLAKEKGLGPPSTFSEFHVAKAVETIGRNAVGRAKLSREIGLGEGATRTLISRLTDADLATSTKQGIQLTRNGLSILEELKYSFPRATIVPRSSITVGPHNFGILVRNGRHKVNNGIEQRDAAVRTGAIGAVTILFKDGRLYVPPMNEVAAKDWKETAQRILDIFKPKQSDAVVICGAESIQKAEDGARAAAWTLIDS